MSSSLAARAVLVLGVALALCLPPAPAAAQPAANGPLRLAIECQSGGRTKACPAFLLGFVEANPLLLASPRANAQVVLYVNAVPIANDDRLHLRFVGSVRGAPSTIEVDVDVDTRGTDDAQRAQLEPAFVRGVALYVATLHPGAVKIAIAAPAELGAAAAKPATSPWSTAIDLNGFGSWSGPYKSANGFVGSEILRTQARSRYRLALGANGGLERQPAVSGVSFNSTRWNVSAGASTNHHLNDCWSWELATSIWRDDPKGQFRYGWASSLALEWDKYPSDDPRGNQLAIAYGLGYRVEGYNFPNELGERFAHYPEHRLGSFASIRKDKIQYSLYTQVTVELLHPLRRYTLQAQPGISMQLGDHVDLGVELSVTKRELPEFLIPPDDPEAVGRAEYAQSLSTSAFFNLRLHWDATNGVRNNRFTRL